MPNSNVLEFFVKMKDLMSGGLAKLAQNSKAAQNKIQGDIKGTDNAAKTYGRTLGSLYDKMNDLKRFRMDEALGKRQITQTTNEIRKLQREIDHLEGRRSGGGGVIGGLFKRLAPFAMGAGVLFGALSFAKSSARQYMDFQKNNVSYEVLAGNKGIGQSLAGDLNNLKQNTILGPAVYKSAQTMMGFGITAEKVIPNLKMLGEISRGDADRLQSLTLAFSQMTAAGRLMGQDLLQFINAGFNPLNEISKMTGKSLGVLRKEMEEGKISTDMVTKAFEHATQEGGLFHGMLNRMADTTGGKLQQLSGKVSALQIAFGERLAPALNRVLDLASKLVSKLTQWYAIPLERKLADQIGQIRGLQAELTASNTTHARQVEILKQLEQINPNIVTGIKEQAIEYNKLAQNIDNVTGSLRAKMFAERFTKDNAKVFEAYGENSAGIEKNFAKVMSIVGSVAPDLALRQDLTPAQKQLMTKQRLIKKAQAESPGQKLFTDQRGITFMLNREGGANEQLINLQNAIYGHNIYAQRQQKLAPEYQKLMQTKQALENQFNKFAGVGSMTAAQLTNGGGGKGAGGSATPATDTSVASGITGGGPRVVNINGVKFTDKVEVHAATMEGGVEQVEKLLEEMFLRILNSGASVQ